MNEINKDEFLFEGSTVTWHMSYVTDLGETFMGTFQFRTILTPMQRVNADKNYRTLIGTSNPTFADKSTDNIAFCASQLKERVIKSPSFWDDGSTTYPGTQIPDGELLLTHVLRASMEAEEVYRENIKKKHTANLERIQGHLTRLKATADADQELATMDAAPSAENKTTT